MTRVLQVPGRLLAISKVYGTNSSLKLTVPKEVREYLGLREGDKLLWYVNERGEVCLVRLVEESFREPV